MSGSSGVGGRSDDREAAARASKWGWFLGGAAGFSSMLDYAIAAEEQRVRVGWSGSAGSDDVAEDR